MRNFWIFLFLSLCFVGCDKFTLDIKLTKVKPSIENKIESWLDTLCSKSLAGRKTASVGDSLAFAFISKELAGIGYDVEIQRFQTTSGHVLRNIIVPVKGLCDSVIVIGGHYDAPCESNASAHYPAANDNASGVITLLGFLDSLKVNRIMPKYSLVCGFWDGEEVFDGSCFWGSRHFVMSLTDKKLVKCYLNYDSVGHEHDLYVRHMGYGFVTHVLEELYSNTLFHYEDIDMNITGGGSSDYVSFSNAGIPFIGFGDHNGNMCANKSHSVYDIPDVISIKRIQRHICNLINITTL